MTEFIDLDSEDAGDLIERNTAFRMTLRYMEQKNDPFRLTIGVWIIRAALDHAQATRLLYAFDCYKEVPQQQRKPSLALGQYCVEYFYKHPGKRTDAMSGPDTFLYHAMLTMRTLTMFYSTDEQEMLLHKLVGKKSLD